MISHLTSFSLEYMLSLYGSLKGIQGGIDYAGS